MPGVTTFEHLYRRAASSAAEGGLLWLAGRSALFLTLLVGWLALR